LVPLPQLPPPPPDRSSNRSRRGPTFGSPQRSTRTSSMDGARISSKHSAEPLSMNQMTSPPSLMRPPPHPASTPEVNGPVRSVPSETSKAAVPAGLSEPQRLSQTDGLLHEGRSWSSPPRRWSLATLTTMAAREETLAMPPTSSFHTEPPLNPATHTSLETDKPTNANLDASNTREEVSKPLLLPLPSRT
jgi:hypothetical protein